MKRGDVVRLVSGGPLLTVVRTDDDGLVLLYWFDAAGKLRDDFIDADLLVEARIEDVVAAQDASFAAARARIHRGTRQTEGPIT